MVGSQVDKTTGRQTDRSAVRQVDNTTGRQVNIPIGHYTYKSTVQLVGSQTGKMVVRQTKANKTKKRASNILGINMS